jgi:hypothetical protein
MDLWTMNQQVQNHYNSAIYYQRPVYYAPVYYAPMPYYGGGYVDPYYVDPYYGGYDLELEVRQLRRELDDRRRRWR